MGPPAAWTTLVASLGLALLLALALAGSPAEAGSDKCKHIRDLLDCQVCCIGQRKTSPEALDKGGKCRCARTHKDQGCRALKVHDECHDCCDRMGRKLEMARWLVSKECRCGLKLTDSQHRKKWSMLP